MQRAASLSTRADHRVKVGGTETNLVYGAFIIDDPDEVPILATLPPVIRITPEAGEPVPSFIQNLQFISREPIGDAPGRTRSGYRALASPRASPRWWAKPRSPV